MKKSLIMINRVLIKYKSRIKYATTETEWLEMAETKWLFQKCKRSFLFLKWKKMSCYILEDNIVKEWLTVLSIFWAWCVANSISAKQTGWKEWFCYTQIDTRIGLHYLVFALVCPLYEVNYKDVTKFNVQLEKVAGNYQYY